MSINIWKKRAIFRAWNESNHFQYLQLREITFFLQSKNKGRSNISKGKKRKNWFLFRKNDIKNYKIRANFSYCNLFAQHLKEKERIQVNLNEAFQPSQNFAIYDRPPSLSQKRRWLLI